MNKSDYLIDNAWLNLSIDEIESVKPNPFFLYKSREEQDYPGLSAMRLMRSGEYLHWAAKTICNTELLPIQAYILEELWTHAFPLFIGVRGFGKSFLLSLYALLRCILIPGTKVVITASSFRQSKILMGYVENIYRNAPILRDLCDNNSGPSHETDQWTMRINNSSIIAIPLGTGEKIRGLRAHVILADEFNYISPAIYETVIAGFAAVSADPIQNVKLTAKQKLLQQLGLKTDFLSDTVNIRSNQAILSGTSGFEWEPFKEYWTRYKTIIENCNDINRLSEVFDGEVPTNLNPKDYVIIRIPYELVPPGFMDEKHIIRAKATMHSGIYNVEYGAVFSADSEGFFKRTLIESCVVSDVKPIVVAGKPIYFDAMVKGKSHSKYVYGIDPASEQDNFSIVILERYEDHNRLVYCWTTNRKDFRKRLRAGLVAEHDFYSFCARKIRDLMKVFPCELIGMDSQGGGIAVEEALHDLSKMKDGELPIWPIINPDKQKDTDIEAGLHILDMVQFANYEWTSTANHGMRKDLEDKVLLFPRFDPITIAMSHESDEEAIKTGDKSRIYDSLETCILEIEELKTELSTIVVTRTGTGVNSRDRWDTPEVKLLSGRKGRLRKDRYSALLIANMVARQVQRKRADIALSIAGGFARSVPTNIKGQFYYGPEWFTSQMNENTCIGVVKK